MGDRDEVIGLLRSIDGSLKQLLRQFQQAAPKPVADSRDLDGPHGNPVLRYLPRDWTGDPYFKGKRFSECPVELLEMVARSLDWQADQADKNNERTPSDKPVSVYKRKDAARARGWAQRIRDGKVLAPAPLPVSDFGDDAGDGFGSDDADPWSH